MNKKHLKRFLVKDKSIKNELARAHGMIILLVIALIVILTVLGSVSVRLDPVLTSIAVVLLALVGVISLTVIVAIMKKR